MNERKNRKCSNPDCTEPHPEFYPRSRRCKTCYLETVKRYQRGKGRQKHIEANRRYRAAGKDKKDKRKWLKFNTVNIDTLKEGGFVECETCIENLDGSGGINCSVTNKAESITHCAVWQDWKHYGVHPLQDRYSSNPQSIWDLDPYQLEE